MNRAALFLLGVGLLQMAGDVSGQAWLKGMGAATTASPAPKVFSAVKGLETYSTSFDVEWTAADGSRGSMRVLPANYSRLRGPYNRRNVYGAALAYGPVLDTNERTRAMFRSVAERALLGAAPLLRELGAAPGHVHRARILYAPAPGVGMGDLPRVLEIGPP